MQQYLVGSPNGGVQSSVGQSKPCLGNVLHPFLWVHSRVSHEHPNQTVPCGDAAWHLMSASTVRLSNTSMEAFTRAELQMTAVLAE